MPVREAMLVRAANYSWSGQNPYKAIEILLEFVNRYPDDPEGWYILGETYVHYGGQIMAENGGNWKELMTRAVQLDPSSAVFMAHLVDAAFFEADSARAVDWLARDLSARGMDPDSVSVMLAFGDPARRRMALAALDTIEAGVLINWAAWSLRHPRLLSVQEEVYRIALTDPIVPARLGVLASENLFRQGKVLESHSVKIDTARMTVEDQREALFHLFRRRLLLGDLGVPVVELERALSEAAADTMTWFLAGAHAADRGRWADHSSAVRRLRETAEQTRAAGDSVRGRLFDGAADAVTGYGYWRQGRPEEATALLEASRQKVVTLDYLEFDFLFAWNGIIRFWLASLSLERDQPEQAVRYLESLRNEMFGQFRDPYIEYELARVQDRLGRKTEAIEAYENAAIAWQDADPVLRPRVEAARRAITRLSGAED
jgi:tetratricopeptide (TPR) repeat protein